MAAWEAKEVLPQCQYGSSCYRKNPDHRSQFWHPEDLSCSVSSKSFEPLDDYRSADDERKRFFVQPSVQDQTCSTSNSMVEETTGVADGKSSVNANEIHNDGNEPPTATPTGSNPIINASANGLDAGILLLLIGVQGSGKSTFCKNLMSNAAHSWTRICQDIIAKGKRGTKKDCLKHSQSSLAQKNNVVIDRCNIDKAQRLEFLQLAASLRIEAHAVVLNLPTSVCIRRASKRVGHEGGVGVGNAGSVINRFARSLEWPSISEGFYRITFCRTDVEVEGVLNQYRELLPSKPLGSGVFGTVPSKERNTQKLEKGSSRKNDLVRESNPQQAVKSNQTRLQAHVGPQAIELDENGCSSRVTGAMDASESSGDVRADEQGPAMLAFPSLSTSDFQFDHQRACDVLVDVLSEFLQLPGKPKLRLVLVDLTESHMLSIVKRKAAETGLDSLGFSTFVGDITKLRSSGGPSCNMMIANAANWRLKGGGGGVNAAIYKAAGPELDQATKEIAQTISPGSSVVVRLPASSQLYRQEGVTHVIHVLGPNMNPNRPNCLGGDYFEGCRILRSAYSSLFQSYSSIAGVNFSSESMHRSPSVDHSHQKPTRNAFSVLMQASKRNLELGDSTSKREKVRLTAERAARGDSELDQRIFVPTEDVAQPEMQHCKSSDLLSMGASQRAVSLEESTDGRKNGQEVVTPTSGHQGGSKGQSENTGGTNSDPAGINNVRKWEKWTLALYRMAMNPENHRDVILQATDDALVIRDAYPKAKRHLLVVTRRSGLDSLQDIRLEHLPVLRHMHSLGEEWAASCLRDDSSLNFRIGYHSVPSMRQLHLHVISQDFESSSLKNKKHWNSFTTHFFRDSLDILDELESRGCLRICVKDAEELLSMELRCHRCRSVHPNVPRLKQHITICKRPFASAPHVISAESIGS